MSQLYTDVRVIAGIGEQRAKLLDKLGIHTLFDLISYFPRAYEDRRSLLSIRELVPGESACVRAMVAAPPSHTRVRRGMDLVKVRAVDSTGVLDLTFFNQNYMKSALKEGQLYTFYGKPEGNLLRKSMVNPLVEPGDGGVLTGRIVPIYPLTAGISQVVLTKAIRQSLSACLHQVTDCLPEELRRRHSLCDVTTAYRQDRKSVM